MSNKCEHDKEHSCWRCELAMDSREQPAKPQAEPSGEQSTQIEIENCTLEIDSFRGVIYVHSPEGFTTLRICGCPTPIPKPTPTAMLDITLELGRKLFSWHPAPLRAQLEALLKQNRRLIERAEAAEAELAEAELAVTRKAQEVHQLKLAKISGPWSRWPHIAPPTDVIEKNKETEPEGERLRAELADWLRHNQIGGILMDTKDHIVDIQIRRLPPRLKWVLSTWGTITVVDDADESTLAELKDKEPTK